jgi:uncharacterized protein (UPF0332 family)
MNAEVLDLWQRACQALDTAAALADADPDAAASRAYYAAYYGVSALFALDGRDFRKHAALQAAVHRDLVKAGKWPPDLGSAFSWLVTLRYTADYGGGTHATAADARTAVAKAEAILKAVRQTSGESLPN